jgi:hypothetical protein
MRNQKCVKHIFDYSKKSKALLFLEQNYQLFPLFDKSN